MHSHPLFLILVIVLLFLLGVTSDVLVMFNVVVRDRFASRLVVRKIFNGGCTQSQLDMAGSGAEINPSLTRHCPKRIG